MDNKKKTTTVAELRSGQLVLDQEYGKMIHSGLAVESGLKVKEPKEYLFFTEPDDEQQDIEQIVIKDPNRVVEVL